MHEEGKAIMSTVDLLMEQVQQLQLQAGQSDFLAKLNKSIAQDKQQHMQVDSERLVREGHGLRHPGPQ